MVVAIDELEAKVAELLETIQKDMFERAKAHRDEHVYDAHDYDEFTEIVTSKPGVIRGIYQNNVV